MKTFLLVTGTRGAPPGCSRLTAHTNAMPRSGSQSDCVTATCTPQRPIEAAVHATSGPNFPRDWRIASLLSCGLDSMYFLPAGVNSVPIITRLPEASSAVHRRSVEAWAAYRMRLARKKKTEARTRRRRLAGSDLHRTAIAIAVTTA